MTWSSMMRIFHNTLFIYLHIHMSHMVYINILRLKVNVNNVKDKGERPIIGNCYRQLKQ